jgi:propionate CoA-transferase
MHYYSTASRYSTSAFLRSKLGAALERRRVAPHIFETVDDAREFLSAEEDSAVGRSYIHRAPQ